MGLGDAIAGWGPTAVCRAWGLAGWVSVCGAPRGERGFCRSGVPVGGAAGPGEGLFPPGGSRVVRVKSMTTGVEGVKALPNVYVRNRAIPWRTRDSVMARLWSFISLLPFRAGLVESGAGCGTANIPDQFPHSMGCS